MCCIWITHSSTDGHLGFFHLLAMVNKAAINMRGKEFFNWTSKQSIRTQIDGMVSVKIKDYVLLKTYWAKLTDNKRRYHKA